MSNETVVYRGMSSDANRKLSISESLELLKWIVDPDSRPYDKGDARLIARSGGLSTENQKAEQSFFTLQKQLELQKMIINGE